MSTSADKVHENKGPLVSNLVTQKKNSPSLVSQIQDNRSGVAQRLQQKSGLQVNQLSQLKPITHNVSSGTVQKHADQKQPLQKKENKTGLPDTLKSGMENLSGQSLDHVKVHYNSPKPAAVQAHAYAQGADIHLGQGQEKHLPHELGHVVQQMDGRVKPTTQVAGMAVNDNPGLESEATVMGARALQRVVQRESKKAESELGGSSFVMQLDPKDKDDKKSKVDKLNKAVEVVTDPAADFIGNEGISGAADILNDKNVGTSSAGGGGSSKSDLKHAKNMGIVGDGITGVTGLIGFVKGIQDLTDPKTTAADFVEAVLSIQEGAMKSTEAVSKLVATASDGGNALAGKLGSGSEGLGDAFTGIKSAFDGMKDVVELVKHNQDYSTAKKAEKSAKAGVKALEAAKAIVLTVKSFIEFVEGAASGALMSAVPALSIAISVAKLIMSGYYLAESNTHRKAMNKQRAKIADGKDQEMDAASEYYRKIDAEISNKQQVIEDDKKQVAAIEKQQGGKDVWDPHYNSSELCKKRNRVKRMQKEIETLKAEKLKGKHSLSQDDVKEYTMATEFRDANTKRVKRQSIFMALEFANIVADVAILTGAGAMGGAAMKGGTAAVKAGMPLARSAKQKSRDNAARKKAKGKKAFSKSDHTKSTAAKRDFRLKQIGSLVDMMSKADIKKLKKGAPEVATLTNYLKATGVNLKKLYNNNGKANEQMAMLVSALVKREF